MKKLFFSLLIFGCINATVSCTKEMVTNDSLINASQSISNNVAITNNTKFGALISETLPTDDKIKILNSLGTKYVRASTILNEFNGRDAPVEKYMNNGFKVLLNL